MLGRLARRRRERDRVADDARIDVDRRGRRLQVAQPVELEHAAQLGRGDERALDDRQLLVVLGVADEDLQHEAVDLRLGQRVRALRLDRVLRRHDEERLGTGCVSCAIVTWRSCITSSSADCTFAGARLISSASRKLQKTGPSSVSNVAGRRQEDARADEVGRDEVRRELDALEAPVEHLRGRLDRERLRQAGHALDQQVAAREQADEDALEHRVLARDHALDLEEGLLEQLALLAELGDVVAGVGGLLVTGDSLVADFQQ